MSKKPRKCDCGKPAIPGNRFCSRECQYKYQQLRHDIRKQNEVEMQIKFTIEKSTIKDFAPYLHKMGWDYADFLVNQICLKTLEIRNDRRKLSEVQKS